MNEDTHKSLKFREGNLKVSKGFSVALLNALRRTRYRHLLSELHDPYAVIVPLT